MINMIVTRTEQHFITHNQTGYGLIDALTRNSKDLYNYANYIIRQEFINNNRWIRYSELFDLCKNIDKIVKIFDTNYQIIIIYKHHQKLSHSYIPVMFSTIKSVLPIRQDLLPKRVTASAVSLPFNIRPSTLASSP